MVDSTGPETNYNWKIQKKSGKKTKKAMTDLI